MNAHSSSLPALVPRLEACHRPRKTKPNQTKRRTFNEIMNITIPDRTASHPRLDRSAGPSSNVPERHPMGTCECIHIRCIQCHFWWPCCHTIKFYEPAYGEFFTICTQCEALNTALEIIAQPIPTRINAPTTPPPADTSE